MFENNKSAQLTHEHGELKSPEMDIYIDIQQFLHLLFFFQKKVPTISLKIFEFWIKIKDSDKMVVKKRWKRNGTIREHGDRKKSRGMEKIPGNGKNPVGF